MLHRLVVYEASFLLKDTDMLKNIVVKSRSKAIDFRSDEPWAAISVSTNPLEFPHLNETNRVNLLQLSFEDSDLIQPYGQTPRKEIFCESHALQVLAFVDDVWDKIETLLVHCEAGLSRSPAIAAAVSCINNGLGTDKMYFVRYTPNRLVYRTIIETKFGKLSDMMKQANEMYSEEKILDEPWDCLQ